MLEPSLKGSWCLTSFGMRKNYAQLLYSQGWDLSNFLFGYVVNTSKDAQFQ